MHLNMIKIAAALMISLASSFAFAESNITLNPPEQGSVSQDDGLKAFQRIYEVTSHPRCANCHVGPDNRPMWSGPSYGKTRPHGMNIHAGESRIGAEAIICSTCHTTLKEDRDDANEVMHAAPHVALDWQLAPVEFEWFGKSSKEICAQLSDPERNGGRDWIALAQHLVDDAGHGGFVKWGWNPGGGREAAPYSLQEHVNDVLAWGAAGTPCPAE